MEELCRAQQQAPALSRQTMALSYDNGTINHRQCIAGCRDETRTKQALHGVAPHTHARAQAEVFEQFLAGSSLKECYDAVGAVANRWLDMLETQVG